MRFATLLVGTLLVTSTVRGQEQQIGLRLIVVRTEAEASSVLARLSKGESFEALATQLSTDPSAEAGGFVGLLDQRDLRREFQTALAGMSPGQVSKVVTVNTGFALLYRLTAGQINGHVMSLAAIKGDRATVERLLRAGVDPNEKDVTGYEAISFAVLSDQWEIADLLIKDGADVLFDITPADARGVAQMRLAADRGYPFAQAAIAYAYQFGAAGVSVNLTEARAWYMKAAAQGHPTACNGLGWMYQHGLGGDADIREAARWYRVGAEKGLWYAQKNLGVMLQSLGHDTEAVEWFRKAAEQSADGAVALGNAYQEGRGVNRDYEMAASLYRKSAELGALPYAAVGIGKLYAEGWGVKQDDMQAYEWFLLAARTQSKSSPLLGSNESDLRFEMEALAKRLTPAQISAAEQWVTQWIETHPKK